MGATNSNSALKGLTTIASNGELQLENGAPVTTTGALTVAAGGQLYVEPAARRQQPDSGRVANQQRYTQIGNFYTGSASTVKVTGTLYRHRRHGIAAMGAMPAGRMRC